MFIGFAFNENQIFDYNGRFLMVSERLVVKIGFLSKNGARYT